LKSVRTLLREKSDEFCKFYLCIPDLPIDRVVSLNTDRQSDKYLPTQNSLPYEFDSRGQFADNPDRPYNYDWQQIEQRGLLAGACGYCANAFEVADSYDDSDVTLLSGADEHAPAIAQLADQNYEIITL